MDWLDMHEPLVAKAIRDALAGGASLQDYKMLKHFSHGSKQVFSSNRWACTGDAGLFLDPFYSPGSDFVSISNTYITELVQRQLDGHGIRIATKLFEMVYQTLFSTGLSIYQGQYPLFGNPKVMPVKILWDICYYWSLAGPLYFAGKLTSIPTLVTARRTLDKAVALNETMQAFFRSWDERGPGRGPQRFHRPQQGADRLGADLPPHRTAPQRSGQAAARQPRVLHEMAAEIVGVARTDHPELARPKPVHAWDGKVTHLGHVYQTVGAGRTGVADNDPAPADTAGPLAA